MIKPYRTSHTALQSIVYSSSIFLLPLALMLFFSSANQVVFHFLNDRLVFWQGEQFWAVITNFGDGFFLFPLAMCLFWRCPRQQLAVIISILLLALVTHLAKSILGVPRPGAELDAEMIRVTGPLLRGDSLPSGHAATAFLLAGLGFIYLKRGLKLLLFTVMLLVALSRIAVGAHWPCDIICGAWIGLISSVAGCRLSERVQAGLKTRLMFVTLGLLVMVVLPGYHNGFQHFPAICLMQYLLATLASIIVIVELISVYREYSGTLSGSLSGSALRYLFLLWTRHQWLFDKLLKFAMVGASGFAVDMAIYALLSFLFGVPHLVARGGSYWCSASWNWFWNRTITFDDAGYARKFPQWVKYLLMCGVSFLPNWGTYYLLTIHFTFFDTYKFLALIAGVAVGMGFNFIIASIVIFQSSGKAQNDGQKERII